MTGNLPATCKWFPNFTVLLVFSLTRADTALKQPIHALLFLIPNKLNAKITITLFPQSVPFVYDNLVGFTAHQRTQVIECRKYI